MDVVSKYFASIAVLGGLINTFITYKRIKSINQNNNDISENNEIEEFIKWHGICYTVPFVCIQIFQLLGNYKTVFYIFLLDFNNPFYMLGFLSMILFWGLLTYIIIIKDGAKIMAKYSKAFGHLSSNKNIIKIFFGLSILAGLIALLLGNKIMGGAFTYIEGLNQSQ
jgi:hypothetical protein